MLMTLCFIGVSKDKQVITFLEKSGKNITIDLETDSMYSFTGRKIHQMYVPYTCKSNICWETMFFNKLYMEDKKRFQFFHTLEPFFPYLTTLQIDYNALPPECPKGFISYIKEHNKTISYRNYEEFLYNEKIKTLPKKHYQVWNYLRQYANLEDYFDYLINPDNVNIDDIQLFCQIYLSSLKDTFHSLHIEGYINDFGYLVSNHLDWHKNLKNEEMWALLNPNKSFYYNIQILSAHKNKERNDIIIKNEQEYAKITQLSTKDYIIIVPEKIEQFTDEGNQQHNCVGSYYHSEMFYKKDFIYFIRKASTPNHSYITCRYHFDSCKTVEYRGFDNQDVRDNNAIRLIYQIDKKIAQLTLEKS